jgi:hypothetical protein
VISIIVLTLVAVAFLLFLILEVRSRYFSPVDPDPGGALPIVDLEAFRNLTDPSEEAFLRRNLSPKEFRRVQRVRLRAAILYVSALSKNLGALVEVGQRARVHSSPRIAASGQEILQHALRLRVRCLATQWKLNVAIICPTLLSPSGALVDRYAQVTGLVDTLPSKLAA